MNRQQAFSLKLKKRESADRASSGANDSSAIASFCFRHGKTSIWVNSKENSFGSRQKDAQDYKPAVSDYNEPPCSSKQADARMRGLKTPKPITRSMDVKPKKSLKFDSNVFAPSSAYAAAVKPVVPTPIPSSALPLTSTPALAPAASVSMKLPRLVLAKFDGDPFEWPEWSGQFLATADESAKSDSNEMKYLKSLLNGQAKTAIGAMAFSVQMYQVAWQTLEHDFGRPELVVDAQPKKIHGYPFIKPHDPLEIVRYSQIVSGCVSVLNQYGSESDINSESVMSSAVKKLPRELQNKWMTYVLRRDSMNKNMRVFSAWLKEIARVQDNLR